MARPKLENRPSKINRSGRPNRTPINGFRNKLTVTGQEPGWHYCWVDDPQVDRFLSGAYEFVTHDVTVGDKKIDAAGQIGGKVSMPGGNGVTLFLMRCLEEDFEADQAEIQEQVDENERAMLGALNSKEDGRYGEVKIESSKPTR